MAKIIKYYRMRLGNDFGDSYGFVDKCYNEKFVGVYYFIEKDLTSYEGDDFEREFNEECDKNLPCDKKKNRDRQLKDRFKLFDMFCKTIKIDDIVVCPTSKTYDEYLIGKIISECYYEDCIDLPHRRSVQWFSYELSLTVNNIIKQNVAVVDLSKSNNTISEINKFLGYHQGIKTTDNSSNKPAKPNSILIKAKKNYKNQGSNVLANEKQNIEQPNKITDRIEKIIVAINAHCANHNVDPIFEDILEEWIEIKKICESKNDFINFSLKLNIIIREKTSNKKPFKRNDGNHRLPDEFAKKNEKTKAFFEIVGAFRNKYGHTKQRLNESDRKISYSEALEKLLGSRTEPTTKEEFQTLQINMLKLFEESMNILLKIIKEMYN